MYETCKSRNGNNVYQTHGIKDEDVDIKENRVGRWGEEKASWRSHETGAV